MPDNIATIAGNVAMMFTGDRKDIWHGLGNSVIGAQTWQDAIVKANLNWQVIKRQNYARNPQTGHVQPVDSYSIFRDIDGALLASTVGEGFTLKQNAECFQFVDDLLQANGGAHYDTAGALGNGATIWCAVRVPRADIEPVPGDIQHTYLVFTTAHDGSMAHTAFLSTVRPVCQNTLRAGISANTGILRIKHTRNADIRFQDAKRTMDGVVMDAEHLRDKLRLLAERRITRESMTAIMDRLFPKPKDEDSNQTRRDNILADVMRLYESNDNNAFPEVRGTAYNLLNSITEYADHYRTARLTDKRKDMTVDMARSESSAVGTGDRLKSQALEVITELTAGAPLNRISVSVPRSDISAGSLLDSVLANHD